MSEARVQGRIAGEKNRRENFSESGGSSCRSLMVLRAGLLAIAIQVLAGCAHPAPMPSAKDDATEESVRFSSGDAILAGTLVLPAGTQRHTAVVLFHGSGPQSRDLFTARWFAAHGIAALAYDKRGVGESSGDFKKVPFMDLCDDGLEGVAYLKSRREIDSQHIGVWGLSQGGWLGPLAASRSSNISFVIAVSGPGVSPGQQMLFYYAEELRARGVPEGDVLEATALRREVWDYMSSGKGYEKAKDGLENARGKRWYNDVKKQQDGLFDPLPAPSELSKPVGRSLLWFGQEMNYDPVPALKALRVPALFLFGDQDRLVQVKESVDIIRQTLTQSGNKDFTIQVFPQVDHGMQLVSGEGEGSIAPEYLETMANWLAAHIGASN
ncbi:MAG TPA: alpha/beta fold hydrolase [Candidatus Limnocylindrales bacterium]|nr:alpha/beta fold hydrolase [Candidatus Limnocylindrales bacterium]